jgi:ATP-dependent RNA helicase DDX51/DBP6
MYASLSLTRGYVPVDINGTVHAIGPIETFRLHEGIIEGLREMSITSFFPIQAEVIPVLLKAHGLFDVLVNAPTGSGKTLTYSIPILQV